MHRILALASMALALAGCCLLPWLPDQRFAKHAAPKPFVVPPAHPASPGATVQPPPAPDGRAVVATPPGHLDPSSLRALASGVTPQAPDPRGLFERSRGEAQPDLRDGLLACRVAVHGRYDDALFAGGADVFLVLTIGRSAPRTSPHRSLRIFTFPVEELDEGESLHARVMDRDVIFHDEIGQGSAPYAGGETRIEAGGGEVVCRPVARQLVQRGRDRAIADVRRAVDRLERDAEPDLGAYDLGYPRERASNATEAIRDALAWMTMSDDALQAQIDRATDFEDRWRERTQDAIEAARDELPEPSTAVALHRAGDVALASLDCGAAASELRAGIDPGARAAEGCVAIVRLTPRRGGPLAASSLEAWGIDPSGGMLTATVLGWRSPDGDWSPSATPHAMTRGEPVDVAVGFPAGTDPALLRIRRGGRPTVLRAR